ncbi:phage head closure protein [Intestinibacter sp.]|uniref:phage head closure protein n=1 Tax=Intestinibacter sp. TaxID=1965304 RepID=UPI002A747402|nr:phage head closure protein [Intestinibacter sp.]MDY2735143.1 phage head closure protein [Intestinibacter sp.]
MSKKFSSYKDGYLKVYKDKELKTDFSAKKNIRSLDSLEFIVKLGYDECSKRQRDFEFSESLGRSLSLKVKTRFYKLVTNKHKVLIGNMLYDIFEIDIDREKQEMYLYMEEVRTIDIT